MVPGKRSQSWQAIVAVVSVIWKGVKKPKFATGAISVPHCVALRVLGLQQISADAQDAWECTDLSTAWVITPDAVVTVLDCISSEDMVSSMAVQLSAESMKVVAKIDEIERWFCANHLEQDAKDIWRPKKALKVPPKKITRTHKRKRRAVSKESAQKPKHHGKLRKSLSSALKRKRKPSSLGAVMVEGLNAQEIPSIPQNFRKNAKGRLLIHSMMDRLLLLDKAKFASTRSRRILSIGGEMFTVTSLV